MNLFAVNRDTTTVVGFRRLNLKYREEEKKRFLKEKFCFKKKRKKSFLSDSSGRDWIHLGSNALRPYGNIF